MPLPTYTCCALQVDLVQMGQKVDDEKDRLLERVGKGGAASSLLAPVLLLLLY